MQKNKCIAITDGRLPSIKEIDILTDEEKSYLTDVLNQTRHAYSYDKTIHELFEAQASITPNNIAVVFENKRLTYKELNQKANQLAHYIKQQYQIKPDDLIVLCLGQTKQLLIAILGILKAGGAYVPIDPESPQDRIKYVLQDTRAKLIITDEVNESQINFDIKSIKKITTLVIDSKTVQNTVLSEQKLTNPKTDAKATNLAYVIYTSGTTGNPKGVMIEHKGVTSLVKNVDYITIEQSDSFIQLADIAFDAATFEIWGALLNGARLNLIEDKLEVFSDIEKFRQQLDGNKITIVWLTKTLFDQLYLQDNTLFKNLKYLLVGGEALDYRLISQLVNSKYRPKYIINGYGPTENTTFSCSLNISKKISNSAPQFQLVGH